MADIRWTKLILVPAIAGLLALAAVSYGDGTADAKTPAEKMVTLQVTNGPVIDAIDLLFGQAGYKYTITSGVSGNITLGLKNVPFSEALKSLAAGANLSIKTQDGRYTISPKPKPVVVAPRPEPVAPGSSPETAPPAGNNNTAVNVIVPNTGPIFYGNENPAPYGYPIPIGGGVIYPVPNDDWVFVTGGYSPFGREPNPVFTSPYLNSPDWMRFKEELFDLQMRTGMW